MPAIYNQWFYRAKQKLLAAFITKPQPKPLTYVGPGSVLSLCDLIADLGFRRVLLVTDGPLMEIGLAKQTIASLERRGVDVTLYDKVLPDPTDVVIDAGITLFNGSDCDSVLAFGGGSSIDCAKVIALAAGNGVKSKDCLGVNKCKQSAKPFFAVPTTAGTGSEATLVAVVSNNQTHEKDIVVDCSIIPMASALDAELMRGLPSHITAATGMDALTHAIESYVNTIGTRDTDYYGLTAAKLIFENLSEACHNGDNLSARQAMALASYYAGLAISTAGVGYVHAISHNLGARYGVPHGLGNAVVLGPVLNLLQDTAGTKLADIAIYVGLGSRDESDDVLVKKLIDAVTQLSRDIGIPASLEAIRQEDVNGLASAALKEGHNYPSPRFLKHDECRNLIAGLTI